MVMESSWFSNWWWGSSKTAASEPEKLVIGVLAFEVASLMLKVVHLWECLSDKQVVKLREDILDSVGVRKLVSDDDDFLLGLVYGEILENLGCVARAVARLGKKCTEPMLQRFEDVFNDVVQNGMDLYGLEYALKKMERKVKKMGRLVNASLSLYHELEVLAELEQVLRRMQVSDDPNRGNMQQKVALQRLEVKNLREFCLWGRTYDYTVHILARSLFTIYGRIRHVFGIHQTTAVVGVNDARDYLLRSHSIAATVYPSENNHVKFASGRLRRSATDVGRASGTNALGRSTTKSGPISRTNKMSDIQCRTEEQSSILHSKRPYSKSKRFAPVGSFKGCMPGGSDSPILPSCTPISNGSLRSSSFSSGILSGEKDFSMDQLTCVNILHANISLFCSSRNVLNAPPSSLGGAALALHYANVIITIEKHVAAPHLIGPDARDDLYDKLPTSLRAALRAKLKSYTKKVASTVYDADLEAMQREALKKILEWLAPLAHNMVRWQSERNFEQQHLVSRTNVLLIQTLYFADRAKTEAVITELLVGLNYLWRFYKELTAKAFQEERTRNRIFDDYLYVKG